MSLATWALVICLICIPSALMLRAHISGKSLMPTLQLLHTLVHVCICTLICIYTVLLPDDDDDGDWSSDVALLCRNGSIVEAVVADVLEGLPMGDID